MQASQTAFNTNEETFYAAATKGWQQCEMNGKDFSAFNQQYTPKFIDTAIKAISTAQALPNLHTRQGILTSARAVLVGKLQTCNNLVQNLYVIIGRAFPQNQIDSMRRQAGSGYYMYARSENWKSAGIMYGMVTQFIDTYSDILLRANMPAGFPTQWRDSVNEYNKAFTNYSGAKDNLSKGGTDKQEANNAVHASLLQMLTDGKAIYRNNPAQKKFFTYSSLVKMVAGSRKTGVRFSLYEAITLQPIANATIAMQPGNYFFYPTADGIATQTAPEGAYTYSITAPGMQTIEGSVKITTGVVRRVKLLLSKSAEAVNSMAM